MKFSQLVAIVAITLSAVNAAAQDGTLRRGYQVAQADTGVVILNTNSNANSASAYQAQSGSQTTSAQPVTVVEASPASDSRAEQLRRERQNAEIQTEQKIVEKLEDARLQEEKARAERLFGNRFDTTQAPVQQQAPAPAPVVVAPAPAPAPVQAPTQVTIEKVEIIQPKEEKEVVIEEKKPAPVAEIKMESPIVDEAPAKSRFFVGGQVGNLSYTADNVKSNYGLGFSVGTLIENRWALEAGYFYSNHYIDTFWQNPLYSQMNQHDVSASAKFYILEGKLKPYIGGSVTYINRQYTERVRDGYYYGYNTADSESTNAVDMGVLAGVDFMITERFMIGGGVDYNFNVMNTNVPNWGDSYGIPEDTKPLETFNHYALKIGAKFLF